MACSNAETYKVEIMVAAGTFGVTDIYAKGGAIGGFVSYRNM